MDSDFAFEILQRPLEELQARIEFELAGDHEVEWEVLRKILFDIINREDKAKPLSDPELAGKLRASGVEVSPHVVRKYRRTLRIPDPDERRKLF